MRMLGVYLFNRSTNDDCTKNQPIRRHAGLDVYEAPAGGYDPPILTEDAVYLFSDFDNDDLLKINISDGTLAWTYKAPSGDL